MSDKDDGWSVFYDTPVKRLLFRCGLRPDFGYFTGQLNSWRYPLPVVSDIELRKPKED